MDDLFQQSLLYKIIYDPEYKNASYSDKFSIVEGFIYYENEVIALVSDSYGGILVIITWDWFVVDEAVYKIFFDEFNILPFSYYGYNCDGCYVELNYYSNVYPDEQGNYDEAHNLYTDYICHQSDYFMVNGQWLIIKQFHSFYTNEFIEELTDKRLSCINFTWMNEVMAKCVTDGKIKCEIVAVSPNVDASDEFLKELLDAKTVIRYDGLFEKFTINNSVHSGDWKKYVFYQYMPRPQQMKSARKIIN